MSTTMYCHQWLARSRTIASALAFTCSSRTVVPYESQLFQPIGGAAAGVLRADASRDQQMIVSHATNDRICLILVEPLTDQAPLGDLCAGFAIFAVKSFLDLTNKKH